MQKKNDWLNLQTKPDAYLFNGSTWVQFGGGSGSGGTGAQWFAGTAITGTGTQTATISGANVGDMYLNTQSSSYTSCGYVYKCTATNTWEYQGVIKGPTGPTGSSGSTGYTAKFRFGTEVTGTSTSAVYQQTTTAQRYDMYINTETLNIYSSNTGTNYWIYEGNLASTVNDTFSNTVNTTTSGYESLSGNVIFGGTDYSSGEAVDYVGMQFAYKDLDIIQFRSGTTSTYLQFRKNDSGTFNEWRDIAFKDDIPSYTQGSGISISNNQISNTGLIDVNTSTTVASAPSYLLTSISKSGSNIASERIAVETSLTNSSTKIPTSSAVKAAIPTVYSWAQASSKPSYYYGDGYLTGFGTAASKSYTTSVTSGSSSLVTSGAVYSFIKTVTASVSTSGVTWNKFGSATSAFYHQYTLSNYLSSYDKIIGSYLMSISGTADWSITHCIDVNNDRLQINAFSTKGATTAPSSSMTIKIVISYI